MTDPRTTTKTIRTDTLARVEGEGAMHVRIEAGRVTEVELRIYEPPRFFEAFLRGRDFTEAVDITSRICGICPVAYQMSAVTAMESLCGVTVGGQLRALRRLLYCGEWIESHALHIFMLHAPDFLGFAGAVEMARDHPQVVADALTLKKAGNDIMRVIGGREIHPINLRVGGLHRAPRKAELRTLIEPLERAREIALAAVRLTASLEFPDYEQDIELVALAEPGAYPIDGGPHIVSTAGLDITLAEYPATFVESHVPWSHALHSQRIDGGSYLVGPLARFATSYAELSPLAREAAAEVGLRAPERNPFRSIIVRSVELVHAVDEALALIDGLRGARRERDRGRAPRRRRPRSQRGTARPALPPLRDRRRGHDPRRDDHPADLAEPDRDRGGPARRGRALARPPRRGAQPPLRADDPQLRPLHLLRDALPAPRSPAMLKAVGVGNRWRRDDAAGLLVAELLAQRGLADVEVIEHEGEPLELIDTCAGAQAVWIIDAASSGAAPGSVHRFDASERELPSSMFRVSTHRLGVGEALELARALGRLPRRVTVYGIEGARFDAGVELSPAVAAAARGVAAAVGEEVVAC